MKRVTAVLSSIFCFCILVQAQQSPAKNWDSILDRYERLCEQCIELKSRAKSGEKISVESLSRLVSGLTALKEELNGANGQMSSGQRHRFEAIRKRYENGSPTSRLQVASPPKSAAKTVELIADTTKLRPALNPVPVIDTDISLPKRINRPQQDALIVPAWPAPSAPAKRQIPVSIPVHASFSCFPEPSYGLMLGVLKKDSGAGAYIRILSNFTPLTTSYDCLQDGSYKDGTVWTSGKQKRQILRLGAGAQFRIGKSGLRFYAGAGYGSITTAWEDVDKNDWIRVTDLSPKGLSLEAGVIYPLHRLELAAGISTIAFSQLGLDFSIGLRF